MVVKELDRSIQVLSDVFGFGPFRTINWPPADRNDIQRMYHGQPGEFTARMAFTELEPVLEYLAGHGIGVSQMGSGIRPGTAWANFDTECKVGFTIEVMKALPGTDGRTPQIVDGKVQA